MPDEIPSETRVLNYPYELFDPKSWLNFVDMPPFSRSWSKLGLDDDDLRAIEMAIMLDPKMANVIPGTGGIRKIRISPLNEDVGKSGGLRVWYSYYEEYGLVALFAVYAKGVTEDLSATVKKKLKELNDQNKKLLSSRKVDKV